MPADQWDTTSCLEEAIEWTRRTARDADDNTQKLLAEAVVLLRTAQAMLVSDDR